MFRKKLLLDYFNKDFFETTLKYIQFVLIWFPDKETNKLKRMLVIFLFILLFSILVLSFLILEIIHLCLNTSDYNQTIRTLSVVMFHFIYLYKLSAWIMDKNTAILCIELLHRKSFNFENFNDINLNFEMISQITPYFNDNRFGSNDLITDTMNLENFWIQQSYKNTFAENKFEDKSIKDVQAELTRETNIHCAILILAIYILAIVAIFFIYLDAIYTSVMGLFFGTVAENLQKPLNLYNPFDDNDIYIYAAQNVHAALTSTFITSQYLGT